MTDVKTRVSRVVAVALRRNRSPR